MEKVISYAKLALGLLGKGTVAHKVGAIIALFILLNCAWILSTIALPLAVFAGIVLWIMSTPAATSPRQPTTVNKKR